MERKNELLIRAYIVMLVFLVFTAIILWRVVNISIVEGDKWREIGGKYVKWIPVKAERGNIYAEDGSLLATSIQFFEIRIDPAAPLKKDFNRHIDSLSVYLARYADGEKTASEWKRLLVNKRNGWFRNKEKGSRNVMIARKVNYDMYDRFKKFPLFKLGVNRGGFIANRFSKREKPFRELASRTIGMDRENANKIGIEAFYDDNLKGEEVQKLMKRIPPGLWIPLYDPSELESKKGDDVVLTIDVLLQDIVHDELYKALKYQDARAGTAIIMEVETGAIKAMANLGKTSSGYYREVYNYAIGESTEPGSTFKLATVLALLEDGHCTLDSKVDLYGGKKKFFDQWMYDSEQHNIRSSTMAEAFTKSSNVGIASLAMQHYGNKKNWKSFPDRLRDFGLGRITGIALEGEGKPYIKDPEKNKKEWYGTTVPWMAHGYEIQLTPLQLLNFYNAVANDGKLMKPYLVHEVIRNGKPYQSFGPSVLNSRIASKANIQAAQEMLEMVVTEGTAKRLKSDKYSFAGKTGTTSINYAAKDGSGKKYNASFVGYFPAEKPMYSVMVVVYEPKKAYYGGTVAGPVFKAIADRCYAIKYPLSAAVNEADHEVMTAKLPAAGIGFARDFENVFNYIGLEMNKKSSMRWVEMKPRDKNIEIDKLNIRKSVVPDVRGMGARDAIYILENLGLKVKLDGLGKIQKQSILPGTKIKSQTIELYLN